MTEKYNPIPGNVLRKVNFTIGDYSIEGRPVVDFDEANVVTSEILGSYGYFHIPVLDIDTKMLVLPSSTVGHYHVAFPNCKVTWEVYSRLLETLGHAGILEPGYVNASLIRGYSCVRLPGIKK